MGIGFTLWFDRSKVIGFPCHSRDSGDGFGGERYLLGINGAKAGGGNRAGGKEAELRGRSDHLCQTGLEQGMRGVRDVCRS